MLYILYITDQLYQGRKNPFVLTILETVLTYCDVYLGYFPFDRQTCVMVSYVEYVNGMVYSLIDGMLFSCNNF